MLFNSYEFIFLFVPITFAGFFLVALHSHRMAALWLVLASMFFYAYWSVQYLLLLLASIGFNYAMGYIIGQARVGDAQSPRPKRLLALAVGCDLLLLGYYKYTDFLISTLNTLARTDWSLAHIILPAGISFYTFTQIAFLVDVYRGIAREYNFIHYALFASYFPHLIAGPVLHHKQMMPQFDNPKTFRPDINNINIGLTIFTIGLFKKVMLADQFAVSANPVFDAAASGIEPRLIEAWIGAFAYTLQLYFDFSGYSDMAIGLSALFNVDLPINFNSPYKALNIIDFWRRWHMTLSTFLRDYVYIPLGGNRHGKTRRYFNLMITMILGGLWHGANWTFILWGLLHGFYLVMNYGWQALHKRLGVPKVRGSEFASSTVTFLAVVVAWVIFRAQDVDTALRLLRGIVGLNAVDSFADIAPHIQSSPTHAAAWLIVGIALVKLLPNSLEITAMLRASSFRGRLQGYGVGMVLAFVVLNFNRVSTFIYFQF
jgi:alginate O-acetyltransferase complex protein AlgI